MGISIQNAPFEMKALDEKAGDILKEVTKRFDEMKIKFWISAGTALCLYRDGDFGKDDTDLDIALEGYDNVENDIICAVRGEIIRTIYDEDRKLQQIAFIVDGNIVDVYVHWYNNGKLENHGESGWTRMDANICRETKMIDTKYGKFPFPQDDYYSIRYGEDWKTPQPGKKPHFYEV